MRVAYFCDTFAPQINGVSTTLEKLRQYAGRHGIETVFLVPGYPGAGPADDNIRRCFSMPLLFYKECRAVVPPVFYAQRVLDRFKPDLIHAYSEFGISLAAIRYARLRHVPIVSSYTSNFSTYLDYYGLGAMKSWLDRYLAWFHNSCRMTFCPTERTRACLYEKNITRVGIMRRGVDAGRFGPEHRNEAFHRAAGARADSLIFTYVGRVSPEKDLDVLARSIAQLKEACGDRAVFVIVGDGPSMTTLRRELGGSAVFTGFLTGRALAEAYASSDVFVFPSTTETFGNVVLEAMCSGLPAVVPDAGGVAELVTDGRDGFVVAPKDDGALTTALLKFVQFPQLLPIMRKNALETARASTWENVFDRLFGQYGDLLGSGHVGAPVLDGEDGRCEEKRA